MTINMRLLINQSISYQSSKRIQAGFIGSDNFAQPKVHNFEVSFLTIVYHENILRFEVPMSHSVLVEVEEGCCYLVSNCFSSLFWNCKFTLFKVRKQVSS